MSVAIQLARSATQSVKIMFKKFLNNENGATAIEYGLIASLVCSTIIVAITALGTNSTVTLVNLSNYF